MPAPTGNTNALIWDTDRILALLAALKDLIDDDDCYYLGQALGKCGTGTKQWNRLKDRYKDDTDLIERMENIEQIFESRILVGSLMRRFHAGAAQLIMRTQYGLQGRWPAAADAKPQPAPGSGDTYRPPYILLSGDRTMDL